jgi:hypothetical protein
VRILYAARDEEHKNAVVVGFEEPVRLRQAIALPS